MIMKTLGTFRGLQSLPALVEFSWHLQDDMKYLDTSLQMTFPITVYPSSPAIDEGNEWDPLQKVFTNTSFLVNTHYAGTFISVKKEGNNNILTIKICNKIQLLTPKNHSFKPAWKLFQMPVEEAIAMHECMIHIVFKIDKQFAKP